MTTHQSSKQLIPFYIFKDGNRNLFTLERKDLLLKLEGFKYATSLDINMGYYHIELDSKSKQLCTIVLPWVKYEYQKLPMVYVMVQTYFRKK